MRTTEHNYARNVLIQMAVVALILIGVIVWQRDFLARAYFHNQLTQVGWAINGGIVLLFLGGIYRLFILFLRYTREERAVATFVSNVRHRTDPLTGLPVDAMISTRYETMRELKAQNAPFNHSALAATLVASESTLISFPKFVNNTLILTGVFGTIVSLSIALLGASNIINDTANFSGLSLVIHGMSTALSTTMTAIGAYLFFGYFFLRLTDAQTYLISRIEDVTSTVLIPRFQSNAETVLKGHSDLVRSATALVIRLNSSQQRYEATAEHLESLLNSVQAEFGDTRASVDRIAGLLVEGFRLHQDG